MKRVLAIGALALSLTGCGTVQNFQRESPLDATPYGGVEIATARFSEDLVAIAMMFPFWTADVVLSAIGDTLTLPVTVPRAIRKGINDYYFPPEEPKQNEWRQFWYDEQPEPPVSGGIY